AVNLNLNYIFKTGITWSSISSYKSFMRILPLGSLFSSASNALFLNKIDKDEVKYLLAVLNSKYANYVSSIINATMNAKPGDIGKITVPEIHEENKRSIINIVEKNIQTSKVDRNENEISWDFEMMPLVKYRRNSSSIKDVYNNWLNVTDERFNQLKV